MFSKKIKIPFVLLLIVIFFNVGSFVVQAEKDPGCVAICGGDSECIAKCPEKTAGGTSGTSSSSDFANPINAETITQVLRNLLVNLKGVIITLSIVFIILGALMYIMSSGNENMIKRAKACIGGAVIGLALALAAPTFLQEIIKIFGGANGLDTSDIQGGLSLSSVVYNVLKLLLSVFGTIAIIFLVIGGMMYLSSGGNEKQIDTAKETVTYAVIGIAIALGAVIISEEIAKIFGVTR